MANPRPTKTGKATGIKTFKGGQPQPTPEQKKAGRERKREAMRIMNDMIKYQDMTLDEFKKLMDKKDTKLGSLITAKYMQEIIKDKKIMVHRLDKHIPNAPTQVTGDDGPIEIDIKLASDEDLLKIIKQK